MEGAAPSKGDYEYGYETGISIMKIEQKLDSGPVMLQSKVNIHPNLNYVELSKEMSKIGAKLILEALELIKENKANFTLQNESKASYAEKIQKSEARVNWNEDAKSIMAKINATYQSWILV